MHVRDLCFGLAGNFLHLCPGSGNQASNNSTVKEGLKNALGNKDTSSGQIARVERVKSFQVPEDAGGFIAYLLEPKPEPARGSTANDSSRGSSLTQGGSSPTQGGSSPTV